MIKKINNKIPILFLMGHTASGKTKLSFLLKDKFPIEIISVDSTLIFREMNIGTAKPNKEELINYPHRLIDIRDPIQTYSVFDFCKDSLISINEIVKNNKIPLLVGGSMFYFNTLLNGINNYSTSFFNLEIKKNINNYIIDNKINLLYKRLKKINSNYFNKVHINDIKKISKIIELFLLNEDKDLINKYNLIKNNNYIIYQFVISCENKYLINKKIKYRFYKMLENGFENEVINLYNRGDLNSDMQSIKSIGYNQMWSFLSNKISYLDMIKKTISSTRNLMKHQNTWIKNWKFNIEKYDNSKNSINKLIKSLYRKIINHI